MDNETNPEIQKENNELTEDNKTVKSNEAVEEKKTDWMMIAVLVIGFILLCVGIAYEIPSRELSYFGTKTYVGGDAYNYIIEASLRGGEISGSMIARAVYICSGIITMSIGALRLKNK